MDGGLEGFFRQIPPGLILMFCGSGALFLLALGYLIWARRRRKRALETGTDPVVTQSVGPIIKEEPKMDDDELPDLDALSHPGVESTPTSYPPTPTDPYKTVKYAPPPMPSIELDPEATIVPAPSRPTSAYRMTLSDGSTSDAVEVLTVLRDVADGSLIIQIGDRSFRHPAIDADPDFKRRLNSALRDLTGSPAPSSVPPTPYAPPPVASTSGVTPPGDLPKFRLEDQPPMTPRRGRNPPPKVEIPEINVGGSIETYLQHKRAANGDFPGRRIHVRAGLGGAIVIEVDGQFYDAVSDVEDIEVRAYLQQTIEEWQSRQ